MKKFCCILLFFINAAVFGQFKDQGIPFIQNYTSNIYGGHAQNWSAVQSNSGKMYFGNTEGILEFDGMDWRLIKLPNEAGVLSLDKSPKGKIFVGAFSDFGFLEEKSDNRLQFVSLKDKIPPEHQQFEAVWETIATYNNTVVFRTAFAIYFYDIDSDKVFVIKPETQFLRLFFKNNQLFFRERDIGFKTFAQYHPKLLPGGELFADESIYGLEKYSNNAMIVFARKRIFLFYPNGKSTERGKTYFEPFTTEIDDYVKKNNI